MSSDRHNVRFWSGTNLTACHKAIERTRSILAANRVTMGTVKANAVTAANITAGLRVVDVSPRLTYLADVAAAKERADRLQVIDELASSSKYWPRAGSYAREFDGQRAASALKRLEDMRKWAPLNVSTEAAAEVVAENVRQMHGADEFPSDWYVSSPEFNAMLKYQLSRPADEPPKLQYDTSIHAYRFCGARLHILRAHAW